MQNSCIEPPRSVTWATVRPRDAANIISHAEECLAKGEPLLAFDVIREAPPAAQRGVRLRQLQGLALARSGATERAKCIFEELRGSGHADEETLGMLARTYKDLALSSKTASRRREFLRRAAGVYAEAYRTSGGHWSGINAATLHLLTGKERVARRLAAKIRDHCIRELRRRNPDVYWLLAALGETALIRRDFSEAEGWYRRAASKGKKWYGHFEATRRNARLILKYWKYDTRWIEQRLPVPSLIVFAGHMIDRPSRATPRFPPHLERRVAEEIRSKLDRLKPALGFSSATSGSDILFLEAMLDRDAEITVVLPFEKEQFRATSVDFIPGSNWRARFDAVLSRATRIIVASPQKLEISGASYEFSNNFTLGVAIMRARQLDGQLIPLAVWDGSATGRFGGTATIIEMWRSAPYEPEIINLRELRYEVAGRASRPKQQLRHKERRAARSAQTTSRTIAILFADAVGFSKLMEAEVPRFVQHFLGAIAKLTNRFRKAILTQNTWGDGLYFVFSEIEAAGNFGLRLADLVTKTKWSEKGLPHDLGLRIALNAGPAYEFQDPITRSRTYVGAHVSRAARIEPITPRNQVYASEAFAALAAAKRVNSFTCDYVGQTPLAKGYGYLPTYHIRPVPA
jgi:class 3 adenylate cyclase